MNSKDKTAGPKKVVVLLGPTAAGKSSLAIELAAAVNAEIVNADSMQIYRGMDIGTAKPPLSDRNKVAHHLIDIVDPDESFNAARYQKEADLVIDDILRRNKHPLIVGGTGLYIKALLRGLFPDKAEEKPSGAIEKINYYKSLGDNPHKILEVIDPVAAKKIHPNDTLRSQRALEVLLRTGKSITTFQKKHDFLENRYNALVIGLMVDRERLAARIENRVDDMIRQGLLKEVYRLIRKGYSPELPAMRSLGYRHMAAVLNREWSLSQAVKLLKRDTRRYAKRQYTWFLHQEKALWLELDSHLLTRIVNTIQEFYVES